MSKNPALNLLIDVANEAVDAAAQIMQNAATERSKANEQLELLHAYRLDYAERLVSNGANGVSATNYLNFQRFLATLDEAISQQNNIVAQSESRLEAGRSQWNAEKRRLGAFETLHTRQRQQLALKEARQEQRASDEIAASLYRRRAGNH